MLELADAQEGVGVVVVRLDVQSNDSALLVEDERRILEIESECFPALGEPDDVAIGDGPPQE
jgi:hypothetical protein